MIPRWYVNLALALPGCLLAACGGDSVAGDDAGTSPCPSIAGTWTVAAHCDPSFVGRAVSVTQSGCSFTDQTFGFSGTIAADGSFTATNSLTTEPAQCTGTASAHTITQTCTVFGTNCNVGLSR